MTRFSNEQVKRIADTIRKTYRRKLSWDELRDAVDFHNGQELNTWQLDWLTDRIAEQLSKMESSK